MALRAVLAWGPPRMPDGIAARINAAAEAIRSRPQGLGIVPTFQAGAALHNHIARDFDQAQPLLRLDRVEPG